MRLRFLNSFWSALFALSSLSLVGGFALAATPAATTLTAVTPSAPAVSSIAGLFQILFGLIVVLGIMAFAAWSFKKLGPVAIGNKLPIKVIGGVSVGNREKIMVVEVADQWIVVGVTSSQINTLSTLPKQEQFFAEQSAIAGTDPFSTWLKRTLDKRNGNQRTEQENS